MPHQHKILATSSAALWWTPFLQSRAHLNSAPWLCGVQITVAGARHSCLTSWVYSESLRDLVARFPGICAPANRFATLAPERTTGSPIDSDASTLQSVEDRECLDELQGEGGNVKSPLFFSPVDPDASTLPSLEHRKRLDELQCVMGNVKDPLRQHEIADSHDRPSLNELDMLPTPRRLSKRKMSDCASVNPGLSAHLHGVDGRCRLEPITSRQPVTNRQNSSAVDV